MYLNMHVLFDPNSVRINQLQKSGVRVVRVPYGGGRCRRFTIPLEVQTMLVSGDRPVPDPTEDRAKKKRTGTRKPKATTSRRRKRASPADDVILKPSIDESRSLLQGAPIKKSRKKRDIFHDASA